MVFLFDGRNLFSELSDSFFVRSVIAVNSLMLASVSARREDAGNTGGRAGVPCCLGSALLLGHLVVPMPHVACGLSPVPGRQVVIGRLDGLLVQWTEPL